MLNNSNWIDKYSPKDWTEILLPSHPSQRKVITDLFTNGTCTYRGIVLYGDGGSGKTTLINALIKLHPEWNHYQISSSGDKKAELLELKNKLRNTHQYNWLYETPNYYLVYGNEISKSTSDYRDGLRELTDEYHNIAFFIFSDNNYSKLKEDNPQLFDDERIYGINYNSIVDEEILQLCYSILVVEGLDTDKNREKARKIVGDCRPSIRKIIQKLELNCK